MPNDFPMKDPEEVWQNQPTEELKMSADQLRHKAFERQSRARSEALSTIIMGIILCAAFAWLFARTHDMLARMGWGLLSLCGIYAAYYGFRWIRPQNLPEEAPISTCLQFYRRELERRRDSLRRWWTSGLPIFLLAGMTMAALGTGSRNAPPHPLRNALPFLVILAVWIVAFLLMRKKLGRENLQREIEELRAFERENR